MFLYSTKRLNETILKSTKPYHILGPQKKRPNEMILLSTKTYILKLIDKKM